MTTETMPRLRVDLDTSRVMTWTKALDDATRPPYAVLGEYAGADAELGDQRTVLAEHAEHVFGFAELVDPQVRSSLVATALQMEAEAEARAHRATELLAGRFFHRDLDLVVRLVPGTRLCYGLPGGGQVFGLVPGASVEEACCFLEHTFYHELSDQWASARTIAAERDHASAEAVVTWILSLVRNEGVANLFCLEELTSMKRPEQWAYFKYADLINCDNATLVSLAKFGQALDLVANRGVEDATAFVNGTLKNPDLPLLNLVGIHLARTVVKNDGEAALAEICHAEPEALLNAWLYSGDPLVDALDPGTRTRLAHWAEVRW